MPNYLVEFFAPPKVVSPDPETASIVISAESESAARRAAERIIAAEVECLETYLQWYSDPYASGESFAMGIHVSYLAPTGEEADITAEETLSEDLDGS